MDRCESLLFQFDTFSDRKFVQKAIAKLVADNPQQAANPDFIIHGDAMANEGANPAPTAYM